MSDPAWELNCEEREELARSNARLAERERDEALAEVRRLMEVIDNRNAYIEQIAADLTRKRYEAIAQRDALREALTPFVEGGHHTLSLLAMRQKMHPDGLALYERHLEQARDALSELGDS